MRYLPIVAICLFLAPTAFAAPELSNADLIFADSFEGEIDGWSLVLNRGAEARMQVVEEGAALGSRSLRVTPMLLHAPDDEHRATNTHLRYETIPLEADTPYRIAVWMRAAGSKLVRINVRRESVEESVGAGAPMRLTNRWQRYEFDFTPTEDYPDATPQILLGEDTVAAYIDGFTLVENPEAGLAPADYLRFAEALAGPAASVVRFTADFEGEAHGWQLQLNRGAQADVTWDAEQRAVCVTPQELCAPTDQPFATNIHLKYEGLTLSGGVDYVYRARLRSEAPREVGLRLRAGDARGSHSVGTVEVGPQWETYELPFTLEADMPAALAQVLIGGNLTPVCVSEVVIHEAGVGDTLPEDCIRRGNMWLRPEILTGEGGEGLLAPLSELVSGLPDSFRLRAAVDMFGADALRLALLDEERALLVDIGAEVVVREAGGEPIFREALDTTHWRPGEALVLTLERIAGRPSVIIGETQRLALDAASFDRVMIGAAEAGRGIAVLGVEGYEMLPLERPDGAIEREDYIDPVTGRRIARLTHSPYNDKHPYYDISPWSPDGSMIVFSSALPGQRDSRIYVMNADGTSIRQIAEGRGFSMHVGANPKWAPDGKSVYFSTRWIDEEGENRGGHARVYLDSGEIEYIEIPVRQVCMATGNLLWMQNRRGEGEPERGLYAADPDGSNVRMLVSTEEICALSPTRDIHDRCSSLGLTNSKWSPDGTKAMVVLVGRDERGSQIVKEIFICDADGSNLRFVMTFNHHHMWHPNSRQVIANCADGLYIVNCDGSEPRKLSDLAQGHPSFSPDGTMIATDVYGGEYANMIVLIDPQTGEVEPIASCPTVYGRSHETGTHPHPAWAPDGRSVIYNSDETGRAQLYQVFVD